MESRTLTKLLNHSIPNLRSCQRNIKIYSHNTQSSSSSNLEATKQQINLNKKYEQSKRKMKSFEHKKGVLSKPYTRNDGHLIFPPKNSDAIFLTNASIYPENIRRNFSFNCLNYAKFSTSTKKNILWDKVIPYNYLGQVPAKLFTQKSEIGPLMSEGIGWAGQPVVKRIHPILPEVYGDVSDILNCVKVSPSSSKAQNNMSISLQMQSEPEKTIQIEHENKSSTVLTTGNVDEKTHSSLVLSTAGLGIPENNEVYSYDNISVISKKRDYQIKNEASYKESTDFVLNTPKIIRSKNSESNKKIMIDTGLVQKSYAHTSKKENTLFKSGVVKKMKKKLRKKTKVCASKNDLTLNVSDVKIYKNKKNKVKAFRINKKCKMEPQLVLNQHASPHSFSRKVFHVENRQLKTDATLYYPRIPPETKIKADKNKLKKSSRGTSTDKGNFDDDCVCPETFIVKGKRRKTRICGEAKGAGEKKNMKSWKPKMCLIEPQVKYRRKTYVCASKVQRDKRRQRQPPKCIKPEKKIAPRVEICPPNIIDELKKKSKTCEIPVEEVKIRKRTNVCKPIIILGKEVTEIKIEKSVCTTGVKKRRSRHTKICLPPKTDKKQIQLKN